MKENVNLVYAPITSFVSLSVPVCLSVSVLLVFHVLLSACLYDIYIYIYIYRCPTLWLLQGSVLVEMWMYCFMLVSLLSHLPTI